VNTVANGLRFLIFLVLPTSQAPHPHREEILRRREEQKQRTIEERLRYNLGRSNLKLTGELESKV
jgi:hypothetical protein